MNKRYGITLIHSTDGHPRLGELRFFEARLDKTAAHRYINLYDRVGDTRLSSSIECDNVSVEGLLITYKRGDTTMLYKVECEEAASRIDLALKSVTPH